MTTKDKLLLVKKYLETGKVSIKDSLFLGIDPWDFPNFWAHYRRLALIMEELIDDMEGKGAEL